MNLDPEDRDELPASVREALARQRPAVAPSPEHVRGVLDAVRRDQARRRWLMLVAPLAAAAALLVVARAFSGSASAPAAEFSASDRLIAFEVSAPSASQVALVGDFNEWNASATPMKRASDSGTWEADLSLPSGRYVYAYVVDGHTWLADPRASLAPADDFARPSSVLVVSSAASPGTRQ